MRFLCCTYALVAVACQATASSDTPPTVGPAPIIARDAAGTVLATVTQQRPCDVQVGASHVTVPALPLLAKIGDAQWAGDVTDSGLVLRNGPELAARVKDTAGSLAVFDPAGAAWIRVDAAGAIHGAGGQLLRTVTPEGANTRTLRVGDLTVTGTRDLQLAALLTASEVPASVRALAVCNHLLQHEGTP